MKVLAEYNLLAEKAPPGLNGGVPEVNDIDFSLQIQKPIALNL